MWFAVTLDSILANIPTLKVNMFEELMGHIETIVCLVLCFHHLLNMFLTVSQDM